MTTITGLVVELVSNPLSFAVRDGEEDVLCLLQDTPEWEDMARRAFGEIVSVTGTMQHGALVVEQVEVQSKLFADSAP